MKRTLPVFFFILLLGVTAIATAQPRMRTPEENVKVLKKQLELTDEQVAAVLDVLKEQRKKFESLRQNAERGPGMREEFMKISTETEKEIMEILDEDQQKAYAKLLKERREMRGRRRRG